MFRKNADDQRGEGMEKGIGKNFKKFWLAFFNGKHDLVLEKLVPGFVLAFTTLILNILFARFLEKSRF